MHGGQGTELLIFIQIASLCSSLTGTGYFPPHKLGSSTYQYQRMSRKVECEEVN